MIEEDVGIVVDCGGLVFIGNGENSVEIFIVGEFGIFGFFKEFVFVLMEVNVDGFRFNGFVGRVVG